MTTSTDEVLNLLKQRRDACHAYKEAVENFARAVRQRRSETSPQPGETWDIITPACSRRPRTIPAVKCDIGWQVNPLYLDSTAHDGIIGDRHTYPVKPVKPNARRTNDRH